MKKLVFPSSTPINVALLESASTFKTQVLRTFGKPQNITQGYAHWETLKQIYHIDGTIEWIPTDAPTELWMLVNSPAQGDWVDV